MIKKIRKTGQKLSVLLFVSGSLTKQNRIYTNETIQKKKDLFISQLFSVYDNHEETTSRDIQEGRGLSLKLFMEETGSGVPEEIIVKSIDGFETVVFEPQVPRYYFPGLLNGMKEGSERAEAMLAFYKNGQKVRFYPHPTVMFGQQSINEQNKDYFAKGVCSLIFGNADRAFCIRGTALDGGRFFTVDQLFSMNAPGMYETELLEIEDECGTVRIVPAFPCPPNFWNRELRMKDPNASFYVRDKDGLHRICLESLYFFLSDEQWKTVGAWDGKGIWENVREIQAGEKQPVSQKKENRLPCTDPDNSDFFIRIRDQNREKIYYYSEKELMNRFQDFLTEETYEYFNHNLDGGKGGIRRVTGQGFLLAQLVCSLPQITGPDMLEEGCVSCRIFTEDSYKERHAFDASELTSYLFMLSFVCDQRSKTGKERGDTSSWEDADLNFEHPKGTTPWRVYCKKEGANPAVYKNVCGMEITVRQERIQK